MIDPSITAAALKKKHVQLLQNVSVRTIQHRLQKDLKCHVAGLLTFVNQGYDEEESIILQKIYALDYGRLEKSYV